MAKRSTPQNTATGTAGYSGWFNDESDETSNTTLKLAAYSHGTKVLELNDNGLAMTGRGTVTQITSKATGVTINNRTGTITMNNATLNTGVEVSFIVTNSVVAQNDVIILSIVSGGTSGEYMAFVSDVGAGTFDITISNMSSGNISDVIIINFAVIKVVS